jgi:hypothetical protein
LLPGGGIGKDETVGYCVEQCEGSKSGDLDLVKLFKARLSQSYRNTYRLLENIERPDFLCSGILKLIHKGRDTLVDCKVLPTNVSRPDCIILWPSTCQISQQIRVFFSQYSNLRVRMMNERMRFRRAAG